MNNQINTYYIPNNPNIKKGQIYILYITNNTNLDLTSIINNESSPLKIIIEQDEYNKLLNTNKQIQELINTKNKNIENFVKEEKIIIDKLSKLNINYQKILKDLQIKDGNYE